MQVNFYHLTRSSLLEALPFLIEKVVDKGLRVVIYNDQQAMLESIDQVLWTYSTKTFLAHGMKGDDFQGEHPVWVTDTFENPNHASVLILSSSVENIDTLPTGFTHCLDMFEENNDTDIASARKRWKQHKAKDHTLSYWQQNTKGGWEKKM